MSKMQYDLAVLLVCVVLISEVSVLKNPSKYTRYILSEYHVSGKGGATTTTIKKRETTRLSRNLDERDTENRSCENLPQKPVHTDSTVCDYNEIKGECRYTCTEGFLFPSGSPRAKSYCENGHWSPEIPSSCILSRRNPIFTESCKITPPTPSEGSSMSCQSTTKHAYCQATCNYGFLFSNGRSRMDSSCSNGHWSPVMEEACEPQPDISLNVSCNVLPSMPSNANMLSCSHDFDWGSCEASCEPGNVSPGGTNKAMSSCQNGFWSLNLWLCQPSSTNSVRSLRSWK